MSGACYAEIKEKKDSRFFKLKEKTVLPVVIM